MGEAKGKTLADFRPEVAENDNIKATRYLELCKSCGECIIKCPVKCISWDEENLGMLGENAIKIDIEKCIGCEMCEQICPDAAIEIQNKRAERAMAKQK
ncbi:MAG: 4Fe-4S binding protein [Patescibacteria group bacterium]|nr:4Fe-4S binding protein [Patescibacteria group bacterium]